MKRAELDAPAWPRPPCALAARRDMRGGSRRADQGSSTARGAALRAARHRRACSRATTSATVHRPRARGARESLPARPGRGRPSAGSPPGPPRHPRRARSRRCSSCSFSRKRSTRPRTRTSSPRSKRPASRSASLKSACEDRARRVAELHVQVRRARTRDLAFLARAREHALDVVLVAQRRDRSRALPIGAGGGVRIARAGGARTALIRRWARGGGHRFMMYGGSDAAVDLGSPSRWPSRPGDGVRVPGLERRRRRRLERRLLPRLLARGAPLRADRLRGVLRLPGQPPERSVQRRERARDRVARRRGLRSLRAARAARPGARAGRRALAALALVHAPHRRPRRSARRAGRRLARRAARRRAAYAARGDVRSRHRPGADGAPGDAGLDL